MNLLRASSVRNVVPFEDGSEKVQFIQCTLIQGKRDVKDEKGNVISSEDVSIPSVVPLPRSRFMHEGETCDMYSLVNLQKSGIQLNPVSSPYFKSSLDVRSSVQDSLNDSTQFEQLIQDNLSVEGSQATINFDK